MKIKEMTKMNFNTVTEAIEDLKAGKLVIVADDEDRENEGDLICIAELTTPEMINFMATEGRGLICLTLTPEKAKSLNLHQMVQSNNEAQKTAFTVSIDAAEKFGVTTGISAFDRAKTIQVAVANDSKPSDLRRPGHIFPLEGKKGGVLERVGQTEASIDLARMAGFNPSGVICEILNPDGTMARRNELFEFAKKHGLKFITVSQIIAHRISAEKFIQRQVKTKMPTKHGLFDIYGYINKLDGSEHVALVQGTAEQFKTGNAVVRMHSECLTGDIFQSMKCDCRSQLESALEKINEHGVGALVYLKAHEGRGIGLINKLKAYDLQDKGHDTVEANVALGFAPDLRDYGVGAQILLDLGLNEFKLITNNPKKIIGLEGYGIKIKDRIALEPKINKHNKKYLQTKKDKMEHVF